MGLRLHDGFETQSFFKTRQMFKRIANRSIKSDRDFGSKYVTNQYQI